MWEELKELLGGFSLENLLPAVIIAVVCLVVIKIVLAIYDRVMSKTKLDITITRLLRIAVKIGLLFVGVIIVMSSLGIPVTSLVAVLSVLGLAISLAVQNFLGNVAGGLQVIATKPFKVGDYVEANGCSGTVQEIGLFHTKLYTPDNKVVYMPNSAVVSANITNYTDEDRRRVDITVRASYDDDTEKVKSVLLKLIEEHPLTLNGEGIEPAVRVNAYQENAIEYVMRAWCADGDYWTVYFDLMDAIKPTFDKNGIAMSYPHVNVHMINK